jgi:hypothetical protein
MGDGEAPVTRRSELQKVVNLKSVATKSWVFQKSAGAASSDLRFAFIFFEMCLGIALTDYREFGEWFRVKLEGPFVPGPGLARADDLSRLRASQMGAVVQKMEPERLFSFTWHPYFVDPNVDYSEETPTLVEFRLEQTKSGILLLLTEPASTKFLATADSRHSA